MPDIVVKLKQGQNLSFEESKSLFSELMEGKFAENQIIEILESLIKKGETKDELAGGIFVLRDKATKVSTEPNVSVLAKRVERSDGYFFKFLYEIHKLITFIFTGKKMNFGNYTCLTKKDAIKISSSPSLWSSYSGTVKFNIKNLNEISSKRGPRYFGPSKMSLFGLIIHSLSIIAVFRKQVFIRSIFIFLILLFLNKSFGSIFIILQILLILFNLIILIISFRENEKHLFSCQNNLKIINNIFP